MAAVLQVLDKDIIKETIAKRIAKEFKNNDIVTLGIGLPTEAANYVDKDVNIIFQSENGILGMGKNQTGPVFNTKIVNAGGTYVEINKGASFYDSQMAFTIMRGGHIDATVLGALQVDEEGSIASWQIPGKFVPGIGGSMDLIVGSKRVIAAMTHTSKNEPKIVKKCTLPLTAYRQVDMIVTERCVFDVTEHGLVLKEINPLFSVQDIKNSTGANFIIDSKLKPMNI
ncbi:MAG: 3-oxoacid CoA-transferase subunit B [Candidatus Gastranaerophilales bacterium]|nr:3-oxoacid CoA-transferase subunit B [Candidatus Gastranaerophilales bacterium]